MPEPTLMEEYLFDLRGYIILRNAVSKADIEALNAALDPYTTMQTDEWRGWVHRYKRDEIHCLYEIGKPFEQLLDHPAWIDHMRKWCSSGNGKLFIDEAFVNLRGQGGATGMHNGGHHGTPRTQFRYRDGHFRCGQINSILALTDIGPGDGATMVIPGSHKSNLIHPIYLDPDSRPRSLDGLEGAIEVHLEAGDAVLFVDCLSHGSAQRINPGERRIVIYRYGPHWAQSRYGHKPSADVLARVSKAQREILEPISPLLPPSQ
ncbi:MAG: phytanoyl-CoA dioxygenase family protein [bacterium]|nr:phytanoyl-CoA dioxygenase family protein [bacterium]